MNNRIKELREDKDILQKQIAEILGITQANYSYIENGKGKLDYKGLIKLALFYNTSIDYLLGLTNQNLPYPRAKLGHKK